MNIHEEIIEFLILNQPYIKKELNGLKLAKEQLLEQEMPIFREELNEQYEARIKQFIAFYCAERLAVPAEWVIIELERIDIEEFLNV